MMDAFVNVVELHFMRKLIKKIYISSPKPPSVKKNNHQTSKSNKLPVNLEMSSSNVRNMLTNGNINQFFHLLSIKTDLLITMV